MANHAVLTADIVNSTRLKVAREKKLTTRLREIFKQRGARLEFYRGDSFQAYTKNAGEALRMALLCRTAAIALDRDEPILGSDLRISIGIGAVQHPLKELKTGKGEAFVLSGRKFDELPELNLRIAITSNNLLANEGFSIIAAYVDNIFRAMTGKQAEVIFGLLNGDLQKQVARKLKKTESTIHQLLKSGRWQEIEKLLKQYENIINLLV